jgi:hypothetical protein
MADLTIFKATVLLAVLVPSVCCASQHMAKPPRSKLLLRLVLPPGSIVNHWRRGVPMGPHVKALVGPVDYYYQLQKKRYNLPGSE